MKQLVTKGLFDEQRDVWTLGASLGLALGKVYEQGKRETFQNVNSLDPDGIFRAIMSGLYPDMDPKERATKLVDHASGELERYLGEKRLEPSISSNYVSLGWLLKKKKNLLFW